MTEQVIGSETLELLTVEQTARQLGIGRTLAWALVQQGRLPSVRFGRLVRVPKSELQAWIKTEAAKHHNAEGI